jgi:hypothetical protein
MNFRFRKSEVRPSPHPASLLHLQLPLDTDKISPIQKEFHRGNSGGFHLTSTRTGSTRTGPEAAEASLGLGLCRTSQKHPEGTLSQFSDILRILSAYLPGISQFALVFKRSLYNNV